MLILMGALWALWGACWLRRVELHREKSPLVRSLGLVWAREGLGPSVRATGTVGGRVVEVRWRRWFGGDRLRARADGTWLRGADEASLAALLTGGDAISATVAPEV